MLTQIHIRDLATIDEMHLNFLTGTTMITGETGAGKSIFIEAIDLALGARGSQNMIRTGKEKADIHLCFDITHFPKVIEFLKNLDLQEDSHECIIRRIITNDGRSRCYINGAPVTVQLVRELGELLFHLHSQHEQQVLLKADTQREMLDRYANHLALVLQVKSLADEWKKVTEEIKVLREKALDRNTRSEYLRFQLDEFEAVKLQNGEWEILETEHQRLTHAEELIKNIQHTLQVIAEDESVNILSMLHDVRKVFENIQSVEPKTKEWMNTLNSILILLGDLEGELKDYFTNTELDPEKLHALEERISHIFGLSRKYKISPNEFVSYRERLMQELNSLNSSDENLVKLEEQKDIIENKYQILADQLTQSRQKALANLQKEINNTIRSLSLPHGEFKIDLEKDHAAFSTHGNERVVFLIKTNPDQAMQPLGKVISGGELSRLSLAVHLALANQTTIPTLVFDEVDTGLSGATAEKIGRLLRKLGDSYQVFCITHQPQVAACGHHHVLVEKCFEEQTTHTRLRLLNQTQKTREIARMLGGEKITKKTLDHAMEVLQGV